MPLYVNGQPRAFSPGDSLIDVLRNDNVEAPCGGKGRCGKCLVTVDGVEMLACRTLAREGMNVALPKNSPLAVELGISNVVEANGEGYGLAVDIGTTTVAMALVDCATGETLCTIGRVNDQRSFGSDVISRIQASREGHLVELQEKILSQLRDMAYELQEKTHVATIESMTVAANTVMCHILTGLRPDSIGVAPYTPLSLFGEADSLPGFDFPVYIAPAVSGYVGGDITADLLAVEEQAGQGPWLLVDVGTNGEMALKMEKGYLCCSTAAGPAFEGDQLSCGMSAAPGAISGVKMIGGELALETIGGSAAKGICGSGLMDAMAVLLELGAVDDTGRMLSPEEDEIPENLISRLKMVEGKPAFFLTEEVYLSQSDVRKIQLGKGAIAAGIQVLLKKAGLKPKDLMGLYLAGGFGSYIRPESAAKMGLIPVELMEKTIPAGNLAILGAKKALCHSGARARLKLLRDSMTYLELSTLEEFNNAFMEQMMFPEVFSCGDF